MINADKKKEKETLNKILKSSTFSGTKRHQELLKYLFKKYTKGVIPKESNIAKDVFGRSEDFDSTDDTIVRSSIYQLRTRIEQYYETEGIHDRIHVTIPKGHYHIEFESVGKTKFFQKALLVTTILSLLIAIFFVFKYFNTIEKYQGFDDKYQIVPSSNPLWSEFFRQDEKVFLIVGDYFFMQEQSQISPLRYIREDAINSIADLNAVKNMYDGYQNYEKAPDSFLGYHSILSLEKLLPSIMFHEMDISIRILSQVSFQDIVDNNVIFVGSLKTIGILDSYLNKGGVKLEVATPENRNIYIDVNKSKGDTLISPSRYSFGGLQEDCSIIAKFFGNNNKKILIFTGIHHIGIMQAVDNFIQKESREHLIHEMTEQFESIPESFVALYRVSGYDKVNTTSRLISLIEVEK